MLSSDAVVSARDEVCSLLPQLREADRRIAEAHEAAKRAQEVRSAAMAELKRAVRVLDEATN